MWRFTCAALVALTTFGMTAAAGQEAVDVRPRPARAVAMGTRGLVQAVVHRVLGPRMFTVEWSGPEHRELIVSAPGAEATPIAGTTVTVQGVIRSFADAHLTETQAWTELDTGARDAVTGAPVLLASSVTTAAGRQLIAARRSAAQDVEPRTPAPPRRASQDPGETRVRPGALSELINELGGRSLTMPNARVVAVINPRAFLVEPASQLPAHKGNLDRILVMISGGQLQVTPALLVGSEVRVSGVARTLVGMQVTREVPWPTELTPELVRRLEVRAAVLATTVETPDGVNLIQPAS